LKAEIPNNGIKGDGKKPPRLMPGVRQKCHKGRDMAKDEKEIEAYCSFCGKPNTEVEHVVAGPSVSPCVRIVVV
jgi:hypothetical protein